jgi:hypothetical protein
MSEVTDPTGGWAKATEATANASKEAIPSKRMTTFRRSGPGYSSMAAMQAAELSYAARSLRFWRR